MDTKITLVNSIILLILENKLADRTAPSRELAIELCNYAKPKDVVVTDMGRDIITTLREIITWMTDTPEFDQEDLDNRLKLKLYHDEYIYQTIAKEFEREFETEEDKARQMKRVLTIRSEIKQAINRNKIMTILTNAVFKMNSVEVGSDEDKELLPALITSIESLTGGGDTTHAGLMSQFNMTNLESMIQAFKEAEAEFSLDGIISYCLQGFNNLFGDHQGGRRGETILLSALQHKFKSGTMQMMFVSACMFNKPHMIDPNKKPLNLHISFENDARLDIMWMYSYIKENETGKPVSTRGMSDEEMTAAAQYVVDHLQQTGYNAEILRFDPSAFTFRDLFSLIEDYEARGFEIHHLTLDYLNMISKQGCTYGAQGQEIRDLFRRVRNFMARKKICFVTAHQMSTEAKALAREGVEMLVNEVAELGYYDSCRTLDNEVDMEIYQHLVKVGDRTFITWRRGKHRKATITPEKDKFCIYEMHPVTTLPWDIGKEPMFSRRLGGGHGEQADKRAWDDL